MKKIMAILALIIICQAGYSQKNVNDLFKEFSKTPRFAGLVISVPVIHVSGKP